MTVHPLSVEVQGGDELRMQFVPALGPAPAPLCSVGGDLSPVLPRAAWGLSWRRARLYWSYSMYPYRLSEWLFSELDFKAYVLLGKREERSSELGLSLYSISDK